MTRLKSYQRDRSLPDPNLEPAITITRAGQILGMGRTTAYAAARDGRFPTIAISPARIVVIAMPATAQRASSWPTLDRSQPRCSAS